MLKGTSWLQLNPHLPPLRITSEKMEVTVRM